MEYAGLENSEKELEFVGNVVNLNEGKLRK